MAAAHDPQITWAAPFLPDEPASAGALWPSERHVWPDRLVDRALRQLSQPGDLVLDPFATQAAPLRLASTSRRRMIVNNANPATLLGVLASASPPATAAVDHAFTRIADAPRRGRTLAHHLAALYETVCPECAQTIVAHHFVWDRAVGEPVEKNFLCAHCGNRGSAPADMADASKASSLEVRGAAYWGLLSRLVAPGDPLTAPARQLQELYPPRALLVISELITASEQRLADSEEQRAARAMILHVLARGASLPDFDDAELRAGDTARLPARRFVEHNLWLAFEQAHHTLRERPHRPLSLASDLARLRAAEGEGRVLASAQHVPELAERLEPGSVALILAEPPRFDPTAYGLGFLWAGWLLGREAANRQRAALSIERWSWDWYARAMTLALRALRSPLRVEGRLMLAFGDPSPQRALAVLAAAAASGWRLVAQATQAPLIGPSLRSQWRFELAAEPLPPSPTGRAWVEDDLQRSAQEATEQLVEARGEPVPLALALTACAVRWYELGLLAGLPHHAEASRRPVAFLWEQLRLALTPELPPPGLAFAPADASADSAGLWMTERLPDHPPLADRLEQFVAQRLTASPAPADALAAEAYAAFPGWQTPDAQLLAACLASYGQEDGEVMRLREEDQPSRRQDDLASILRLLYALGRHLGFQVWMAPTARRLAPDLAPADESPPAAAPAWTPASVVWHVEHEPTFAFAVVSQAGLYPWLQGPPDALAACPRYVALPGGRAELLDFMLRRCPPWRTRLAWTGWEFVKFRHLRELAAMPALSLAGFRARIGLDPIVTLPGQQLTLFDLEHRGDTAHA